MRPQEILGLVEEAAGTRMYEDRKDKAKKTMTKKDKRLAEITSMLEEEIGPKLEKLRGEKRAFLDWQKALKELERLKRNVHALEWTTYQKRVKDRQKEIEGKKANIVEAEQQQEELSRTIEEHKNTKKAVEKKMAQEQGSKTQTLQDEVQRLDKELEKLRTQREIKQGAVDEEKKAIQQSEDEIKKVRSYLAISPAINTGL